MTDNIRRLKLADKARDFTWVKEIFEEGHLYLDHLPFGKTNFEKFRGAIKCIQEVYEDSWDLEIVEVLDSNGEDFLGYSIGGVIIHFKEINIRNSMGQSHLIEDLFVKIRLNLDGSNLIVGGVSGYRTKVSFAEWSSNYMHSHLPGSRFTTGRDTGNMPFNTFCLGSGEIRDHVMEIQAEGFSQTRFTSFLLQVIGLVTWESLEGGPHKRIGSIRVNSNSGRVSSPSKSQAMALKRRVLDVYRVGKIIPKIDFVLSEEGYTIVGNAKFLKFLENEIIEDKPTFICMRGSDGQLYQYGSLPGFDTPPIISKKYIFQGREIPLEIGPVPTIITEEDVDYFLHPKVKTWIKESLEYEINTKKIRKSTIDRYTN